KFSDEESKTEEIKEEDHFGDDSTTSNEESEKEEEDTRKLIFIKNIPKEVDANQIRKVFIKCGNITDLRLPVDKRMKRHKGFCHIEYKNNRGFLKALELNGETIWESKIYVTEGTPK